MNVLNATELTAHLKMIKWGHLGGSVSAEDPDRYVC